MRRYFIYLSYNGKRFCGWQIQPDQISVQQVLEESLGILLRNVTPVVGAGRTDAGVHASGMVAHFNTENKVDEKLLADKLNRILPHDIAVQKIREVTPDAHARFDATSRTYRYYLSQQKDPFKNDFFYRVTHPLDFQEMNYAAQTLFDYTDFTSFSKLHTDVKTNNCKIIRAVWEQEHDYRIFVIQADRFLRNMVRAIVGTLLEVGRGKLSVEGFRKIIEQKDRCKAGTSAPGYALFLTGVTYPDKLFITDNENINP